MKKPFLILFFIAFSMNNIFALDSKKIDEFLFEQVGGYGLTDVLIRLGRPQSFEYKIERENVYYNLEYPEYSIFIWSKKYKNWVNVEIKNDKVKLYGEISIGSSEKNVYEKWGKPTVIEKNEGKYCLLYFGTEYGLECEIKNSKVSLIRWYFFSD